MTRKKPRWPTKYGRRLRVKMSRIVFPESDTEPEKYSRRSRQVRVFFAGDTESTNTSVRLQRSRGPRKNYMEDSEDKPIQQNVRRSGRKRKLLHHSFNESWITNELKVRGYPGLTRMGFSSSEEYSSGDQGRPEKGTTRSSFRPAITDEDTLSPRQTRNSSRSKKTNGATESESEVEKNETVIEKKPKITKTEEEDVNVDVEDPAAEVDNEKKEQEVAMQDSESNQGPATSRRPQRTRRRPVQTKKEDSQETPSDSDTSDSDSEIVFKRQPRRSNRTRKPKPAFVQIAPRQTRKRAQSPSTSSSSSSSSGNEEDLNVSVKNKTKGRQKSKSTGHEKTNERALREIQPVEVDGSVRFSSVGGLEEHIKCLREMVLFPLMYPELFEKFGTRPAKGVLFHGPPGTGKTLLARALATECGLVGGRKVAFFMRKGADCLKKWVGESERHLKLLFQQANKMKPSIIFFDEIDALAPVRSVRQEQVHTSVVGTLLAEMDGLCDRGEVVVIGATNRLDAVDPALRRAGRFDRELHFPPPHASARRDILNIYTSRWQTKPKDSTLNHIAQITNGYGGSDLKALCSEAVLKALRRVFPQVYESEHALIIDANKVEVTETDMLEAMHTLVAAGARTSPIPSKPLPAHIEPLLSTQVETAKNILNKSFIPPLERRLETVTSSGVLLVEGPCADTYIAPALLVTLEQCAVKELSMSTLHSALAFTPEQALISVFSECRRADRGCIMFARDINNIWNTLGVQGGALFLQLWRSGAAGNNSLLLATSTVNYDELPQELQDLFPLYKDCVYRVREPNSSEVINFLKPIITEVPLQPPVIEANEPLSPLPRAPPPLPPKESPAEIARRKRKEDYKLRELRIFLRDICRKLASNRRFYKFTKPVDLEEVTDYLDIVTQPMDLETMMTKVDMHKYNCAKEFLDDIDLICANALEYNPDRTSSDKQIRHEACSLRDHAHALIEVEMDSDFELECREIAKKRQEEGTKDDADVPDFIYTASNLQSLTASGGDSKIRQGEQNQRRKRRRINTWSKGFLAKRSKNQKTFSKDQPMAAITDEESKENKPITSTPLPNGTHSSNDDSMSEDDIPLKLRVSHESDLMYQLTSQGVVKGAVNESASNCSATKSTERTEKIKTTPKKRNSGHDNDTNGDTRKILINKTELDNIVYKNAKTLRSIGLEALIQLHTQISTTVCGYTHTNDRTKLPTEIQHVVQRYIQHLVRK